MPDITIASTPTGLTWQGGTAPKLIIESGGPFITDEGVPVNNGGGPFREEWDTEVVDGYIVVPDVTLPSTENSSDPSVVYFAYFQKANAYDSASRTPYSTFGQFRGFRVPASPASTTWEDINDNMGVAGPSALADRTIRNLTVTQDIDAAGTITAPNFVGDLTGDTTGTHHGDVEGGDISGDSGAFTGNVSAGSFTGSMAGGHSFPGGATLVNNAIVSTGSAGINADSDGNGVGEAYLSINSVVKFRARQDGLAVEATVPLALPGYATGSLPAGAVRRLAFDTDRAQPVFHDGTAWRTFLASARTFYASRHGAALNSNVITGGGTSDTAILQDLLDLVADAGGGIAVIDGAGLSGPLLIHPNTTLFCPNPVCGLYLENGSNVALLRNANPTTGAVTDENIALIGGTYNGNSVNQTGIGEFDTQEADGTLIGLIQMYGVDNLRFENLRLLHSKTIAAHVSNAVNFHFHDLYIDNKVSGQVQQGGLQLDGPVSRVTGSGLRGTTEDDLLALNTNDADWVNGAFTGLGPLITNGDITDVSISNIVGVNANYGVRTFNGTNRIDRVYISGISGKFNMRAFHNDPVTIGPGNIGTMVIDGINVTTDTAPFPSIAAVIDLYGRAENLVFTNINVSGLMDTRPIVKINAGAQIESLVLGGLRILENTTASAGFIPIDIAGSVGVLTGYGWRWIRDMFLAYATDFLKLTAAGAHVEELNVTGVTTNRVNRIAFQSTGRLLIAKLTGVRQKDCEGGATVQAATAIGVVDISNWDGDYCVPAVGTFGKKKGDAFPLDTTAPTFSSASATGGAPFVAVTFSETINSSNLANGVTIKKNTVTQTISSAKRREYDSSTVEFVLAANIAGGDTVTWEYASASGNYADLQNNPLANVSAQAVSVSRTGYIYDLFTAANGTAMNGRTPSPLTTSANTWATLIGTAGNQTIRGNRLHLDATSAAQSVTVNSTAANIIAYSTLTARHLPAGSSGTMGLGLIFRASDASNYWLVWLTSAATTLFKVVAGVTTSVQTVAAPHFPGVPYNVQVIANGNSVSATVNGGEAVGTTDAFNNTATRHGIHALGAVMAADDFTVVSFS